MRNIYETFSMQYHYDFAVRQLGVTMSLDDFNQATYFTNNKSFFAGTIQTFTLEKDVLVLSVQVYPDDVIHEQGIVQLVESLNPSIQMLGKSRLFVSSGPQQTFSSIQNQLQGLNFTAVNISEILANVNYLPLNTGEAWGYIRLFPVDQGSLTPMDIPVFSELPLDLSVVNRKSFSSFLFFFFKIFFFCKQKRWPQQSQKFTRMSLLT